MTWQSTCPDRNFSQIKSASVFQVPIVTVLKILGREAILGSERLLHLRDLSADEDGGPSWQDLIFQLTGPDSRGPPATHLFEGECASRVIRMHMCFHDPGHSIPLLVYECGKGLR